MPRDKDGLTPRQAKFVREYLKCLNATQAAKLAGYSQHTAFRIGTENLHKPAIASAIAKKQDVAAKQAELTHQDILDRLSEDRQWARQTRQIGAAVRADELIGKHLGMFVERVLHGQDPNAEPLFPSGLVEKFDKSDRKAISHARERITRLRRR